MNILKTALEAIETLLTDNTSEAAQAAAADARIKLANAMAHVPEAGFGNIVEPVAHFNMAINETVGCIAYEYGKHNLNSGTPLYLHPPQQVAVPSGARAELIAELRASLNVWGNVTCAEAADMLEADAREIESLECDYTDQVLRAGAAEEKVAQQAKRVPMTPQEVIEIIPGMVDCLCDPYDKQKNGDEYSSVPIDMLRLARAIEAHHGIGSEA